MWTAALLLGMVALASGGPLDTSAYGSAPAPPAPSPAPPAPSYASPPAPTYANPPAPAPAASYSSPPSPSYANPSPPAPAASYGGGNSYGQKCKTVYETVQTDKCEAYTEKVCYTTQQESCVDVPDQNCRAITSSQQIRQCFNVTELKCGLKEDVQYETVQAVFTVQKCHTVTERVCDTVYETVESSKDDYQCINVRNSICSMVDQSLVDKTCKTTTKFDCGYGGGYGDDASGQGGSSGGYGSAQAYGSNAVQSGGYGGGYECKRSYNTQCYNTPRVVNTEKCVPKDQQICEKLVNLGPQPKEKQVCHNEEKKICELEQRSQPKQIKKYTYTTACRSIPSSVCDSADIKRLVPSCVPITRKYCTYSPVEKCEDIPKQYCYKVPSKVPKQKCYNQGYGEGGSNEETYEAS